MRGGTAGFLTGRLARTAGTLWLIVTVVFFATRLTGNPIDFLMPEGLDQSSRSAMIAYWGLDRPVFNKYMIFWRALLFTLVALLVIAIAGTGTCVLVCVMGLAYWAQFARLVRGPGPIIAGAAVYRGSPGHRRQRLARRDLPFTSPTWSAQ